MKFMICVFLSVALLIGFTPITVLGDSEQDVLYVENYSTSKSTIYSGDIFDLTIKIKDVTNYADKLGLMPGVVPDGALVRLVTDSKSVFESSEPAVKATIEYTMESTPPTFIQLPTTPFSITVTFKDLKYIGDGSDKTVSFVLSYIDENDKVLTEYSEQELTFNINEVAVKPDDSSSDDIGSSSDSASDSVSNSKSDSTPDSTPTSNSNSNSDSDTKPPSSTPDSVPDSSEPTSNEPESEPEPPSSEPDDTEPEEPLETTPPVILPKSTSYGSADVMAGETFTLEVVAQNVSTDVTVNHLVATIVLPDEMVLVGDGSGAVHFDSVSPGEQIVTNFSLKAHHAAINETATVEIVYTGYYHNADNNLEDTKMEHAIVIPVHEQERLEIAQIITPETISHGEECTITVSIVNKGVSAVSNINANLFGEGDQKLFEKWVGTLDAGEEKSIMFDIEGLQTGELTGSVIIEYEDTLQVEKLLSQRYNIDVLSVTPTGFPNFGTQGTEKKSIDDATHVEDPRQLSTDVMSNVVMVILAVGIGTFAGGFLIHRLQKVKKQQEQ